MATAGSLPPLSTNGKTFINDPKISNSLETKASIKLKFKTPKAKDVIIVRNFQLSIKNKKYEFKRLEQILKSNNQAGELVTINSTCMDIDKQIPLLMHASKAILENVIFCHQEEINWPFSEAGNLKKVFDEIFDTAKYTKALEDLKDTNKSFVSKSKDLKTKIELIQKDFEQFNRITHNYELTEQKITELTGTIETLDQAYKKTSSDLEQILVLERSFKEYENGINLAKAKKDEKKQQIDTILSDPMFEDYTKDETTYENYINNYKNNMQMFNEQGTDQEKINNIEKLSSQLKALNEQLNTIDAHLISKQQIYNNFIQNRKEIIRKISLIDTLELNIPENMQMNDILHMLEEKEKEVISKKSILSETLNQFIAKETDKQNDIEVNKHLLDNKAKEIDMLETQKKELISMISNVSINNTKIAELDALINQKKNEIVKVNYDIKQCENDLVGLESNNSQLKLKLSQFGFDSNQNINSNLFNFHVDKLNQFCLQFTDNENKALTMILKINHIFSQNFSCDKRILINTLDSLIAFIKTKTTEITEEKQKIREESLILNLKIEQHEKSKQNKNEEINILGSQKEKIMSELRSSLSHFGISFEKDEDLQTIINFKKELEEEIETKDSNYKLMNFEKTYLTEYLDKLKINCSCPLCLKKVTNTEILLISKKKNEEIHVLSTNSQNEYEELQNKKMLFTKITQCDNQITSLRNLIEQINTKTNELNAIDFELKDLINKKKFFENSSKEKSKMLFSMNEILNNSSTTEDIFKIKAEKIEIEKNIRELCTTLGIGFSIDNFAITDIIAQAQQKSVSFKEIISIENQITENETKINKLNHEVSSNLQIVTKLNEELKEIEQEKKNLISLCDEHEINNKITEIEAQLSNKVLEKEALEREKESLEKLKSLLDEKKQKFDELYSTKSTKYKEILDTISNFKLKYEYILSDFTRSISPNEPLSQVLPEEKYMEQLNQLNNEKTETQGKIKIIENELGKLSDEAKMYEKEKKQHQLRDNIFKNNVVLHKTKKEILELEEYIKTHEQKLTAGQRLFYAKDLLTKKNQDAFSSYNVNLGKRDELKLYLQRLKTEKSHDNYINIERRYSKLKLEYILSLETSKQIENYYEALDQALLKYHGKRMEEINKLINYYWGMTYKGTDIKWIEIRSDVEKIGRSRNYNYRIVFGNNNGYELDMRGRCSAGQKILASIIIRLALAETFCNSCGILCLDEPTTNLDKENSRALAQSLREIIQSRGEDQNFQLIVITHDQEFVELIGTDFCETFWEVSKNENNFSTITSKRIGESFL